MNEIQYDVHLEIFEGPFDLLLYLIKKNDLEISEIPIAKITEEYLNYLEAMKTLNLEVAGEFLVMASTLMQIKARMLLPSAELEEVEGPLGELKARLLEYQKFKEAAKFLSFKENEYSQIYYRPAPVFEKDDFVLEVSLFDLVGSFREVLKELPENIKEIVYKEIPIEEKIREILDLFEGKKFLSVKQIFKTQSSRQALIVSFLAILELIRLKQIIAKQSKLFDEIRIYRVTEMAVENTKEDLSQGKTITKSDE
ncbi:MAG: segregation/condensation protein A [Elusimicrobia bacterium]|nr:segregation/condensation protein A [Elusimicrobiota bacterium]